MQPRTVIKTVSRRPPLNHQQVKRKVQPGQSRIEVTKQQQASHRRTTPPRLKSIPPLIPATTPTKRVAVVAQTIKPIATKKGRIPAYNPNIVEVKNVRVRKQTLLKKTSPSRKRRLKPMARTLLYALRLLVVGVGVGAIVGTALSVLDPATRIATSEGILPNSTSLQTQPQSTQSPPGSATGLFLTQEITALKTVVQNLAAANPNLTPGVFLVDLENGGYVDVNAASSFASASTIKIPILVAFFQDVDAGKIRLDETLTMEKEMVVGGSGDMQYKAVGTQFTAIEVATKMMTVSDNTATNMLIARLGGIELLNQRFRSWGLTTTAIRNPLPDLAGTNTTSPKELGNLMAMVSKGNLVSMPSRDRILDIMRRTVRNHLLPTGLGQGATIAHKTGDIGTTLADAGLVDMPTGKRYIVAVMVQRPNNDSRAEKLIGSISRAAYQHLSQPAAVPGTTGSTVPPTGYQSPVMSPPLPNNNMGSTIPNNTTYQPPVMSPPLPNNMGSTIPNNTYQPPVMNPQYYYPYQR
jgi:beta-lactamase class A